MSGPILNHSVVPVLVGILLVVGVLAAVAGGIYLFVPGGWIAPVAVGAGVILLAVAGFVSRRLS
jgi:hypothetical protein